ncbi:hypothetical protein BaRGS_00023322, partial [Batillaria attramentaria]
GSGAALETDLVAATLEVCATEVWRTVEVQIGLKLRYTACRRLQLEFIRERMATRHVELKDKFGNDICFGHGGDILCPVYVENRDWRQHLRDLKDADLKSSDVIIAGYPKTGTHWTIEIVHMLMRNTTEYDQESELPGFFDFTPQEKGSNPPDSPPRLFSTHLMLHHLPRQVWEKKVKVVYLLRNPKDVWVSLYHQTNKHRGPLGYEGTWNQFFSLMISFG